jgi:hypothetical protein
LNKIKDAISDPTWSERKEVRRTIEHYSKVLFEGDKSAISSIVSTVVKDYDKELDIQMPHRADMWGNLYNNKIGENLYQSLPGIDNYTKRLITLFVLENTTIPKSLVDILNIATEINKIGIDNEANTKRLNFLHFKQFIKSSNNFLKEHESFSLDTHFYKALSTFFDKLITKEEELQSAKGISEYLEYDKSYIDTYHEKLAGPIDSKIFSESLYNYQYFKTISLEDIQIKSIEQLNSLKTALSNEITLLTEVLEDYLTAFELKDQNLKYDEDARKVINKLLIPLIEIINNKPCYSILIVAEQIQYYIERVKINVIKFKTELDKIVKVTEQNKELINKIQSNIDLLFDVPFNKTVIEINDISKNNFVSYFLMSVKRKDEFLDLFADDKRYSQATNFKLEAEKVAKLIEAIAESYRDQQAKATKRNEEISLIVGQIEEVNALESKIEELLNTNING